MCVWTVVYRDFEWDPAKAASNRDKHGVTFEDAARAFKDPHSLDFDDVVEPANMITLAATPTGRILYIVSTVRADRIRITPRAGSRPRSKQKRAYAPG